MILPIGCKGTVKDTSSQSEIFNKRCVKCNECSTTYNSCAYKNARNSFELSLIFTTK